MKYELGIQNY